ncbi:dephospho-CoA kinase [Sphingobacterium suaedae]|uniref:Dephospho-CoA kinase n=1 Tax=Sphingobacterium suaedae TaxID=1686402 RepID=A0ABW5KJY5_9SPHI
MGLKIGITGGIGSGKSYVAKIFRALGVPFYDADYEAKHLMNTSETIRAELIDVFGERVYNIDGRLDKNYLSAVVFTNQEKLNTLNAIIHPIVIEHGKQWAEDQTFAYSLKEAALLFETGSYQSLDYTILVMAPMDLRIDRVIKRDGLSREQVLDRIEKQMKDEEKIKMADFVLSNDEKNPLLSEVLALHELFLKEGNVWQ